MASGRAAVFIDAGYLDKILKNQFQGVAIDLSRFSMVVTSPTEILRT